MYLKSLELHGFKSFPNRTVLTFERGATVIVGPNGSGKSNISDAMRWVLGELSSRNIRGTKMEDVIFGGTDERRPMGFAEVSVTFDNSDPEHRLDSEFDEVVVTRRYYRTGDSEYLINKEPKRLRDIYELFMNTGVGREGYSIIGQGKVAEIVSKKSDERRNIFEEAAGISKYRHRKEESERKLKNTQENLDRVKDILFELESRVGPLEKEAEKARKGLAVYEEKKRADVSLWLYDTRQIRIDIENAENTLKLSRNELEIIETIIRDLNAQNDDIFNRSQENKATSSRVFDKIRDVTDMLHKLDNALRVAESQFEHSAELIAQCNERIDEISKSEASINQNKKVYDDRREEQKKIYQKFMDDKLELLSLQQEISQKVDTIKKELQEALDELTVEENSATDLKVRIDVLKNSKVSDGTKSQDLEEEIKKYEKESLALKEEADRCEAAASEFKEKITCKDEIISKTSERLDELSEEKEQITEKLNSIKLQRDELLQRANVLQRMVEHFEGYSDSIKFVMREYNEGRIESSGTVHGPLSSLINVDKQYITAIETALGGSLQNIVVDDEATAKAAMYALKRANAGRATFYPITAIRSANETDEIRRAKTFEGFIGRADTLVVTDSKYRSIIEFLLLRTLVFDNIDNASAAAKKIGYKVKMVTLDGQVINAGGAFTGGSAKRDSGILTRLTEINSLKEKGSALGSKIEEYENALFEINAEHKENVEVLKAAEQEKEILLTLSRGQFAALDTANANYNANRNIVEKLNYDYNNLIGQQSRAQEEIIRLEGEYKANLERIEGLREFRIKRADEMGILDEKYDEYGQKANEIFVKATESRKDIESLDQMIESIDERLAELAEEKKIQNQRISDIEAKCDSMDETREQNQEESKSLEEELKNLNDERRALEAGGDEFDRTLAEIRVKLKEKTSSRDVCYQATVNDENLLNRLVERQEKLGAQLWDDYEISYEDAVALGYPPVTAENRDEIAQIQSSSRAKLRALGNYNPGAIEEYAEVKMRYDALNTQYVDLTNSYDELVGIISRLEDEMRTSFVTAFEAINKNFGITFKELFGGGSAELNLVDPEDVLTSGIEIKAAPPGKIIKNMSLLSGGEQSFVAIALLFAILKVNPTPFCILDEIEAALDEVNVFRFGEYIKKLANDTQFILITHRRGTMEVGNRLYGVTMPQRGISQAIVVNVDEIEGKQKELLG